MSWINLIAKGSNTFLLVEYWSPYEQVLGTLVNRSNHKGVKVLLASLYLTRPEAKVAFSLNLSQLVKPTNVWHEEGRQPSLPITPHSRIHISGESPW